MQEETRVVLVTGGTCGVGLECCRTLVAQGNVHVIVVGRNVDYAVTLLTQEAAASASHAPATVQGHATDLASLASVRELVKFVITQKRKLFALVCNAGVESPATATSADGFETTFATNHLGHFLLATSLFHSGMFQCDAPARLVVVSSALHVGRADAGLDVSDWHRVAFGDDQSSAMQKYTITKLCNLLFAYEFQRRHPELLVYAYTPGFVPDTGLFRNHSSLGWLVVKTMIKAVAPWRPTMALSTPQRSGTFLARLASDDALPWDSGSYLSIDHLFHSSPQSHDAELARQLWDLSCDWVDR